MLRGGEGMKKVQASLRKRRLSTWGLGWTPCLHLLGGGQRRSTQEAFWEVMLGLLVLRLLCEPGWIPSCSESQVLSHLSMQAETQAWPASWGGGCHR